MSLSNAELREERLSQLTTEVREEFLRIERIAKAEAIAQLEWDFPTPGTLNALRRIAFFTREAFTARSFERYHDRWEKFLARVHEEGGSLTIALASLVLYPFSQNADYILTYAHEALAVLPPIICAAYGALKRPSSAGPPIRREGKDHDESEVSFATKPMTPSSSLKLIVWFIAQIFAASFMIKWFPTGFAILMGWFSNIVQFGTVSHAASDMLDVLLSCVFPSKWYSKQAIYYVDPSVSQQLVSEGVRHRIAVDRTNPFPGPLSGWSFLRPYSSQIWNLRALLHKRWVLKGSILKSLSYKGYMRINNYIGLCIALLVMTSWKYGGKPWQLNNIIGLSQSYVAITEMGTPGRLSTGLLLFVGALLYDAVMVYYT